MTTLLLLATPALFFQLTSGELQQHLFDTVKEIGLEGVSFRITIVLALLGAALNAAAIQRFKRGKLVFD